MSRAARQAAHLTEAVFRADPHRPSVIESQPVPTTEDRITITGVVAAVRMQQPYSDLSPRMLVMTDDGHKLWGTRPVAFTNVDRGARITFSAKVQPSRDDSKFGFFSRPTKCRVLEAAP